ncbi:MAG: CBS domain-containing protein [Bdellovibrionales bacterium]|nr:CBS domain-containing protein [Bdellovibrionales bacterium]
MPVEEFTSPNPITASESSSIEELRQIMDANGIRHIPIVNHEKVVGIISDRDLRVVAGLRLADKKMITASDLMVRDPLTVSSEMPLDEVAFEMSTRKVGSVIVNDENDELLGIFTVTDALNALIEIARQTEQ